MTLQRLLGIELPLIQAPMAGVHGSALEVAVSNAGGLGSLPCAILSLDAMRNGLAAIRAHGVADEDIVTSFFNIHPQTVWIEVTDSLGRHSEPRITGYIVNNTVQVTVRDIDNLGSVVDTAVSKGQVPVVYPLAKSRTRRRPASDMRFQEFSGCASCRWRNSCGAVSH